MNLWDVIMIGLGLSMDAVAVTMSNSMVCHAAGRRRLFMMPVLFGLFQAIMPLIGYYSGGLFTSLISRFAGIAVFIILGTIGGKMLWDGMHPDEKTENTVGELTYKMLLFQAIATSIDAFAVGIGFSAVGVPIFSSVVVIGITTFFCSLCAIGIGKKFGDFLESKAEVFGGVILLLIGMKALL